MPDMSFAGILHAAADYFSACFSYLFSILSDHNLLAFISYLGIILTIYYSVRAPHKRMRYAVAQKGNEYVIAFWNSCSRPIFKEDIFALCLFTDGFCTYRKVYQDGYEAPFDLSSGSGFISYDEQLDVEFDYPVIRRDLSFDFLNRRRGYIVLVSSDRNSTLPFTTLSIYGKLRGEPPTSVIRMNLKFPLDWFESFKSLFGRLFRIILYVVGCSLQIYSGIIESNHTETWTGMFFLILYLIMIFAEASSLYANRMPLRMRRIYKKFLRSDFREIRPFRVRSTPHLYCPNTYQK